MERKFEERKKALGEMKSEVAKKTIAILDEIRATRSKKAELEKVPPEEKKLSCVPKLEKMLK